jgi:hypothetical protein
MYNFSKDLLKPLPVYFSDLDDLKAHMSGAHKIMVYVDLSLMKLHSSVKLLDYNG